MLKRKLILLYGFFLISLFTYSILKGLSCSPERNITPSKIWKRWYMINAKSKQHISLVLPNPQRRIIWLVAAY